MTSKIKSSMLDTQTQISASGTGAILAGTWYIGTSGLGSGGTTPGTLTGPLTGNADTATTLKTGRAINGVGFDGSQAITVGLNTTSTATTGTYYVPFVSSNSAGNQQAYTNGNFSINPNSGTLSLGGAINATNLPSSSTIGANVSIAANASVSGTNTGDQNLSGYALLSGATFSGAISANNLSGTNTGDQNLSGYAPLANPNFTGSITLSNGSGDGLYLGEDSTNTYWGLWNKNVDPAAQPVNYENDYIIINNGSVSYTHLTLPTILRV